MLLIFVDARESFKTISLKTRGGGYQRKGTSQQNTLVMTF